MGLKFSGSVTQITHQDKADIAICARLEHIAKITLPGYLAQDYCSRWG